MTFSCWLLSVCRSLNLDPSKIVQPLSQSCIIAFLYEPNDERLLQCRCCLKLARGNSILELLMGHCARSWRKRMRFEIHDLLIFFLTLESFCLGPARKFYQMTAAELDAFGSFRCGGPDKSVIVVRVRYRSTVIYLYQN